LTSLKLKEVALTVRYEQIQGFIRDILFMVNGLRSKNKRIYSINRCFEKIFYVLFWKQVLLNSKFLSDSVVIKA